MYIINPDYPIDLKDLESARIPIVCMAAAMFTPLLNRIEHLISIYSCNEDPEEVMG